MESDAKLCGNLSCLLNSMPIIMIGTRSMLCASDGAERSLCRSSNADAVPPLAGTRHLVVYDVGLRDDSCVTGGPETNVNVDIGEDFPTIRDISTDVLESHQTTVAAATPEIVETSAVTESPGRLPRYSSVRSTVEPEVAYSRHSDDERLMTSSTTKDSSSDRKASYGRKFCPTCRQCATMTTSPSREISEEDLLSKVMQQNARVKQTLREVISKQGLTPAQYLVGIIQKLLENDIKERDDVILLLRYEIDDYRRRYRNLCDLFMRLSQSGSVPLSASSRKGSVSRPQ